MECTRHDGRPIVVFDVDERRHSHVAWNGVAQRRNRMDAVPRGRLAGADGQ